jgi:predicted outer membrane repeat protein
MRLWIGLVGLVGCTDVDKSATAGTPSDTGRPAQGDTGATETPVDSDGDGHLSDVDCDDSNPAVHPGAAEECDGRDNDCDGELDEDGSELVPVYVDADGDGFGTGALIGEGCATPEARQAAVAGDCDDSDPLLTPAHFIAEDGSHSDVSALLLGDDPMTVTELAWDREGTLRLCPGDWAVSVEVQADLRIEGPLPATRFTGAFTHTPVVVLDDSVDLEIDGVDLVLGRATRSAEPPFGEDQTSGGNLFCGDGATVALRDLRVEQGVGEQGGGLFLTGRCEAVLENVVLEGNRASDLGGAIGGYRAARLVLDNVAFINNHGSLGGALGLSGGSVRWEGGGVTESGGDRGAVWVHEGGAELVELTVTDNEGESCGAVCLVDADLEVRGGTFSGNRVERSGASPDGEGGGAIFHYNGEMHIADAVFDDNHAARDGGAIRAGLFSAVTVERCTFTRNSAGYGGGAIALDGADLSATDTVFSENTATGGGALGCDDRLETTELIRSSFTGNSAVSGGAISCGGSALTLDGVELRDNVASHTGGGLSSAASTTLIVDSELSQNQAQDGGGASLYSTDANIENTVFNDNLASRNGGALAAQSVSEVELHVVSAEGNGAGHGGGLWVNGAAAVTGTDLDFADNLPEDVYSPVSGALGLTAGGSVACDETGCR